MTPQVPTSKYGRWWWLALVSFAIGLVVLAPAALLEWASGQTPNAKLRFIADAGTVWTGRGRVVLAAEGAPVIIPLQWRFDPLSLLRLRLAFYLEAEGPALSGATHVGFRFRDFELRDTAMNADARLLSMTHSAATLAAPAGKVRLQQSTDEHLTVSPAASNTQAWRVDGSMGISAEQLAFGGIINWPASSHALKLRGDGAMINMSILRSSGPLKFEGAGTVALAAPRRFTFSGFATTSADAPSALKQLGPVLADGRQRIEINTPW